MGLAFTTKLILFTTSLVFYYQVTEGSKTIKDDKFAVREYIDINGTSFYIDTTNSYLRDEAKTLCESLNMKMVTFDSEEKWTNVMAWLSNSDFEPNWFWTSAMREVNSTVWYWETTSQDIVEFHWKIGQPTMNETLEEKSCISFSYISDGWDDDECSRFNLDAMCEA